MPFCFYYFITFAAIVLGQGITFINPATNSKYSPSENPIFAARLVITSEEFYHSKKLLVRNS